MTPDRARAAKTQILSWGSELGLSAIGIAPAEEPPSSRFLFEWLRCGHHGEMDYLARDPEARVDPERILAGCRSVICAALRYGGGQDPARLDPKLGRISRYAWGDDYHIVLGQRLQDLAARIGTAWPGVQTRVAVDTSPVLERAFAAQAGLGWVGKHTILVDPVRGSWFVLGEVFTTLSLPPDAPVSERCGSCTRCMEACPTRAIVEPYVLDAGRCLSFWSVERRGPIPAEFSSMIGNWIFGCDLCQEVCPWNREAPEGSEAGIAPRAENIGRSLAEWSTLGVEAFRERFRGSSVKRARYEGFMRNVAIAVENARQEGELQMNKRSEPVRLYGASWSPECRVIRRFLERHRVAHEMVEVDRDPAAAAELRQATGRRQIPALRIGAEWLPAFSREEGFRWRELAMRLGIPLEEVPELREA